MNNATRMIGVMPPPPGQKATFENPPSQMTGNIVLHSVCLSLVTLSVSLRLYTRKYINRELSLDDYLCMLAFMLTIVFSGLMLHAYVKGLGRHMWDVTLDQFSEAMKALTIGEFIYLVLAADIKLSCLLFYRRVFHPRRITQRWTTAGIGLILVVYTAMFFANVFQCTPVRKSWIPTMPGRCFPPKILPYLSGVLNSATDIYVLIIPIRPLWDLQMDLNRKLRVMAVFGVGIFACITSIVRLGMTGRLYSDLDATWNLSEMGVWAVLEVNIGIICSCLLALPAFIKHYWPKHFGASFQRLLNSTFRSRSQNTSAKESSITSQPYSQWKRTDSSEEAPLVFIAPNGTYYKSQVVAGIPDQTNVLNAKQQHMPSERSKSPCQAV